MATGAPSTFRKVLESRLARLAADLETQWEADAGARASAARRTVSEQLNQAVRRLRGAGDFSAAAAVLLESTAGLCNGAAVFRVTSDNEIAGECVRGVEAGRAARFVDLKFPAASGAVFAAALEGGDPLVTMSSTGELSPAASEFFLHSPAERIVLFPIGAAARAAGVLYVWGKPEMAALELLAQAAGMALAARPAEVRPAELVAIAAAAPEPPQPPPRPAAPDWTAMPPAERDAHLRAQRYARVQVAELRLYRPVDVAAGRAKRDLYGALADAIDRARETFRVRYLLPTPGMADYFHEELLRTLADNDPALLGAGYPGPLA